MSGFAQVLAAGEAVPGGIVVDVPETWHQGRTAYGGFSSALCLAAAQHLAGSGAGAGISSGAGNRLAPLRSAQLAMMAPVAGRVTATARIERTGRNATWISARIDGEHGLAFTASFVFMAPVDSALHLNDRAAPDGVVPVTDAAEVRYSAHVPAFLRSHFESRHAALPAGGRKPELFRWVRLADRSGLDPAGLDPAGLDPMVEMLLLGDALPPGVMPLLDAGVPVSTMHWQANLLTGAPRTDDGWWLLRSVGDYAEQGCSSQRMAIWNTAGEPVMAGTQSIAVFG